MGSWGAGISGNDTAMDLRSEYQAAFYFYDVETALEKIDAYVRKEGFDESDAGEWCDYYYSLADFMWKKGILTEAVRDRAIGMIDAGFGLDIWEESGKAALRERNKVLEKFRENVLLMMWRSLRSENRKHKSRKGCRMKQPAVSRIFVKVDIQK